MDERLQIFQDKMEKSLANLNEEFAGIRAGRANPHVLDKLRVDYYGTPSPIQSVANVSVPEPRMIQIQPWEASMVKEIEKAILSSDLGINPTNDGKLIRLVFPELTEERRKELAKDIKKKGEKYPQRCDGSFQKSRQGGGYFRGRDQGSRRRNPETDRSVCCTD